MTITYTPQVWDVRPNDAGSISTLPKLGVNDWPTLLEFMQGHWSQFDILGTHGEQRAQQGERWWAIGAVEVKEGPAVFQPQFRKDATTYDDGNILSFFWWTDAPALDPQIDVRYHDRAVYKFSEGADSVGYHHGSESGPYAIWLNSDPAGWTDRRVGSDCLEHVHWFDNHVCLNPVFWPMRKGNGGTPPTDYLVNIDAQGNVTGRIPFKAGPPPAGEAALAFMRDGDVVSYVEWKQV